MDENNQTLMASEKTDADMSEGQRPVLDVENTQEQAIPIGPNLPIEIVRQVLTTVCSIFGMHTTTTVNSTAHMAAYPPFVQVHYYERTYPTSNRRSQPLLNQRI